MEGSLVESPKVKRIKRPDHHIIIIQCSYTRLFWGFVRGFRRRGHAEKETRTKRGKRNKAALNKSEWNTCTANYLPPYSYRVVFHMSITSPVNDRYGIRSRDSVTSIKYLREIVIGSLLANKLVLFK